ncbi:EAL domain-containing protein [Gymnodinialimonas sp. 2305UL16-5]|uniref:sensor domain-containing phosphodiesterase n=1 Tax=Gymnodinialimonas mytili TaxID=3126503 RepID=UPI0030AD666D
MSEMGTIAGLLAEPVGTEDVISDALHAVRTHLDMECAYLCEFAGDELIVNSVDSLGVDDPIRVGERLPLAGSYCWHVRAGRLPELIPDTFELPLTMGLKTTHRFNVRSFVGVPIRRADGTIYGMFNCYSPRPNPDLTTRDLKMMKLFAQMIENEVRRKLTASDNEAALVEQIKVILEERRFEIVYQPILDLRCGKIVGLEALCRFDPRPYRPPNLWFDDAEWVGMGCDLELVVMEESIKAMAEMPEGSYLSLNASPKTIASGKLPDVLADMPPERVVIEVTEHVAVADWAELDRALSTLRSLGYRIAIDDAGAGYAGLQHMVRLRPEIIKLDRSLVNGIHQDRARRSLCAAMVHYARETNATLVAEGIESAGEAAALADLGVQLGQGFHLGRPAKLAEVLAPPPMLHALT